MASNASASMSKDMSPKEESASPSSGSGSMSIAPSSLSVVRPDTTLGLRVGVSRDADDDLEEAAFCGLYSNGAGEAGDLAERDDDTLLAIVVVVAELVLDEKEDEADGDSDDDLDSPLVQTVGR